ncbi:M48 family metalloprotease [Marilutibacter spongiae]|uniref:Putative beta-barrel assembly-enhancing protease n=1 Tax=Marilutibacter spongiae TaxID=2025720 RepID=A0A7W3Y6M4_9GAMM|nr:M48 family metalloprotease [Lysobacter spongiae]MBB1061066.1 M48 family metallopeptidase [Lysobacter spongiae]
MLGARPPRPTTRFPLRRIAPLAIAVTLAVASVCAPAQENRLPDIGSSAGELLSPTQQEEYGAMMLAQLRHYEYVLEDPLIDSWLSAMGGQLAANSDRPTQPFTFFMMRERQINAFATLGGYIGVNAGLVLASEREDEVAGVVAHEIAHVTQYHVLRGVERAQRDQVPILLAMLGALAAAQAAGGNSADDAAQAAMVGAMGLMQQRQINYTRANESEADRLGIQTLSRSDYDPVAMADFFATMQAKSRTNAANYYGDFPDYLRTHPVTTTRITEAKERARQIRLSQGGGEVCVRSPDGEDACRQESGRPRYGGGTTPSTNPLLPGGLVIDTDALASGGTGLYEMARERLRVLSADTPAEAIREYAQIARVGRLDDAQRYGQAIALLRNGKARDAATQLAALHQERPDDSWVTLGLAEAESRSGQREQANERFEALLRRSPNDRAVALTYARALAEYNTAESGKRAQAVLRPLLSRSGEDPEFQQVFARACEIAGDPIRAGEAYAEAAYLNGRPELALTRLNLLKKRDDLDYYARARIESRIAAITPTVLELRRQGIRDEDLKRD